MERVLRLGDLKDEDGDSVNNEEGANKGGATMTPSTAKNATRMKKKRSAMTTAAKNNNNKKKLCEESCGVVELVQAILVLTLLYKVILYMVRDVRTFTT